MDKYIVAYDGTIVCVNMVKQFCIVSHEQVNKYCLNAVQSEYVMKDLDTNKEKPYLCCVVLLIRDNKEDLKHYLNQVLDFVLQDTCKLLIFEEN